MNEYAPQVAQDHYARGSYRSKDRWLSYFYQLQLVRAHKPSSVLEIGPGEGVVTEALRRDGINVTTCDIAPDLKPDIVGTITALPFEDASFDLALAAEVLEHIRWEDAPAALSELARVSRGWVVISLPHPGQVLFSGVFKLPRLAWHSLRVQVPFFWKRHEFNGEHYWELGKRGYPVRMFIDLAQRAGLQLASTHKYADDPVHCLFVFKKKIRVAPNGVVSDFPAAQSKEKMRHWRRHRTLRVVMRRTLAFTIGLLSRRLTGISILMYHSISDSPAFFTVTPEAFERQMRYISERGFRTVFASELPQLLVQGDLADTVCITFDDGYTDNYAHAFPILKKYKLKATIFIITQRIASTHSTSLGHTFQTMNGQNIDDMLASGLVEFMPHSRTHPVLTRVSEQELDEELSGSRDEVEAITRQPATIFAYPKGRYDLRALTALRRLGFRAAVTVRPGIARQNIDLMQLPRNPVDSATIMASFKLMLSDGIEWYGLLLSLTQRMRIF